LLLVRACSSNDALLRLSQSAASYGYHVFWPQDIQDLARYVLSHRIWLGPHAASHGLTTDMVIDDVLRVVAIP